MHKIYKFDDIVVNSTTKKKPEEIDRLHYIGLEHIDSGTFEISRWGSDIAPIGDKLVMKKGDVLFGKRRAYQRKVAIAPFDGIFSAHGMVLRPKEDVICKEYFPFFISSNQFMDTAVRISVGGLSPTVNWKDLQKQEFELPSIAQQRVLADKLWAAYNLKEAYKKMNSAIDEMVKSQFIEMFGNPLTNCKKWTEYGNIGDHTTIILGSTPSSSNSTYWDGNVCWITPAEINDETFVVNDTIRHITQAGVVAASLTKLPIGTVLFSTRAPIGKVGIAGVEMYCNQGFKNFVCSDRLNNVFLYYTLKLNKDYLCSLGTGTIFGELSKKVVESIKIAIPPIEVQNQFETIFKQADKSKFELKQAIDKIEKVMKSLLQ